MHPGAEGLGSMLGAAALGPFAVGVAVFALSQKVAANAITVRKSAMDMSVSVEYYGKLEHAARSAGVSMGEVTSSISGLSNKARAAATGDIGQSTISAPGV